MFPCECGFSTKRKITYTFTCRCGKRTFADGRVVAPLVLSEDDKRNIEETLEECGDEPVASPGPGFELTKLFVELGITRSCYKCRRLAAKMNLWGVNGCRERMEEIVGQLRTRKNDFTWPEKVKAAILAIKTGLAFKLDLDDPFPGLVEESIKRAERVVV